MYENPKLKTFSSLPPTSIPIKNISKTKQLTTESSTRIDQHVLSPNQLREAETQIACLTCMPEIKQVPILIEKLSNEQNSKQSAPCEKEQLGIKEDICRFNRQEEEDEFLRELIKFVKGR